MFRLWPKHQATFNIPPYEFNLYDIWRKGFKTAVPVWLKLLIANYIFVAILLALHWIPLLGKIFPILDSLRIRPDIFGTSTAAQGVRLISQVLLPFVYWLFISTPVYIGLHLIALRIAYQRDWSYYDLTHYISFAWWTMIINAGLLSGFVVIPFLYGSNFLLLHFANEHYLFRLYLGFTILTLYALIITIFLCFSINLIFMARLTVMNAIKLSYRAVKMHFWKICGMLILLHVTRLLSFKTHFLADIILMPPAYMAWALLYKHIFGEKGLVE